MFFSKESATLNENEGKEREKTGDRRRKENNKKEK